MLVVAVAAQPDASDVVRMRPRPSVEVIVFEHAGFGAPVPLLIDESAPGLVPEINLAPDRGGDGSPAAACCSFRHASGTRLATHGEPLLLHLLDEKVNRQFDDARQVARGKAVPEQILSLAELVAESAPSGELKVSSERGAIGRSTLGAETGADASASCAVCEGARDGSLRMPEGTGDLGASPATNSSISRFDLPVARARISRWLSAVR